MSVPSLLDIARAISEGQAAKVSPDFQGEISAEMNRASDDPKELAELSRVLFNGEPPLSAEFFDSLKDLSFATGISPYNAVGSLFLGKLFIEIFNTLDEADRNALLLLIPYDKHDVFLFLKPLSYLLSTVEFSPTTISDLFKQISNSVKYDLAGGAFYDSIEKHAVHFPKSGLVIVEGYLEEGLDEHTLHIAAMILGYIRVKINHYEDLQDSFTNISNRIRTSVHVKERLCYHRSWVFTSNRSNYSFEQLKPYINDMLRGAELENSEAFAVLLGCLVWRLEDTEYARLALNWLTINVSQDLPAEAKLRVVEALWRLLEPAKHGIISVNDLNALLVKCQPIAIEHRGIWDYIWHYLEELGGIEPEAFKDALMILIDSSQAGFVNELNEGNLKHSIINKAALIVPEFLNVLLFSSNADNRAVGITLFKILGCPSVQSSLKC